MQCKLNVKAMPYAFFGLTVISMSLTCLIFRGAVAFRVTVPVSNETLHPAVAPSLNTEEKKLLNKEKVMKDAMNFATSFADGNFIRNLRMQDAWNISSQCYSHLLMTADALRKGKTWALKLIDASGKTPSGIFAMGLVSFGKFDECLAINVSDLFQGMYCIAEVGPPKVATNDVESDPETGNSSDEERADVTFVAENTLAEFYLRISVCLPSTCSSEDIAVIASKFLRDNNINMGVRVTNCQIKKKLELETNDYICIVAVGVVLLLSIAGSMTDLLLIHRRQGKSHRENSAKPLSSILCFSICWNTEKLLKVDRSTNAVTCFYGMKVVACLWVILYHGYAIMPLRVRDATDFLMTVNHGFFYQILRNGFPMVGVFFFISGALVMYGRMKAKNERLSIPMHIFHRIWRLSPLLMFTAVLQVLVYRLGSGPYWITGLGREVQWCQKNWWSTFLYVSNIVNLREPCMRWAWYLSADTQLYMIALIVIFPIRRRPKIALGILVLLAVLSVASSIANHIYFNLPADVIARSQNRDVGKFVPYGYFPTYLHSFGYVTGMASGYVLYYGSKFHVSKQTNAVCWFLAFLLAAVSIYSSYALYFIPELPLPAAAAYQPVCNVLWSLALAWLTISCFTGHGGFVNKFLSWRPLCPLSRLTFSVYLVHPLIQRAYAYSIRVPFQSDHRTSVFFYLGNVLASYAAGYFMSMFFEAPFLALEKVLFRRPPPAKTTNSIHEDQMHMHKVKDNDFKEVQETSEQKSVY